MDLKRTATIGIVGGALAAWLAAAATSGVHDTPRPPIMNTAPIDRTGADLVAEIARLHERLRPTSAPRQPRRNLFRFQSRASHPAAAGRTAHAARASAATAPAAALQPPATVPALKLSGIAEDPGPDGPIRTAIISAEHQVFLVKKGEMVTPQYRVNEVFADRVELIDVTTNIPLRLVMK